MTRLELRVALPKKRSPCVQSIAFLQDFLFSFVPTPLQNAINFDGAAGNRPQVQPITTKNKSDRINLSDLFGLSDKT